VVGGSDEKIIQSKIDELSEWMEESINNRSLLKQYGFESNLGVIFAPDFARPPTIKTESVVVEERGRALGTVVVRSDREAESILGGLAQCYQWMRES